MTKEVKLKVTKPNKEDFDGKVKKEVKKEVIEEAKVKEIGTPQKAEEIKKVLSQEEINVQNSKRLRKTLKDIQHVDLIGYIMLFNDHKTGRVGVLSSIDQAVSQFVALAHGGYVDKYDQIINQCITTRTIERMNPGATQRPQALSQSPKQIEAKDAEEAPPTE